MTRMAGRVVQAAYHRNGVSGAGFHAVLFETTVERCARCRGFATLGVRGSGLQVCVDCDAGLDRRALVETETLRMVAAVFDRPGHVAVLSVAPLSDPEVGVTFGANSWRGDQYESELRAAIAAEQAAGRLP